MKWFIALFFKTLVVFAGFAAAINGAEMPDSDVDSTGFISVRLSRGASLIENGGDTFFIHYREGILYHRTGDADEFSRHPLNTAEDDPFLVSQIEIYSEVQLVEKEISSEEGLECTVMQAPRAALTRAAAGSSLTHWGLRFQAGIQRFRVDDAHPFNEEISTIADHNRSHPGYHPLLVQLDPSLMIKHLGGVPVELIERERSMKILFSIESENDLGEYIRSQK